MVWVTVYGDAPSGTSAGEQLPASTGVNHGKNALGSTTSTLAIAKMGAASGVDTKEDAVKLPASGASSDATEAASTAIHKSY